VLGRRHTTERYGRVPAARLHRRRHRCTVADCLLRLHRTGYLTREPLNGRAWLYRSARPLAVHLACVIADLLQCSPDPAVTLRLALADGGCNADPERDRRSIS